MDEARALLGVRGSGSLRIPNPESRIPAVRRMVIDQSGMGLAICEQLSKEFPDKVEGLQFTQQSKERLAVLGKRRMEEMKVRLPDTDAIRRAFRGVKKVATSTGLARFDSEHDSKYGHADHWWAFCLAEAAAEQPMYHLADVGALIGKPIAGGLRAKIL
jgi:phage FluMu gp28-like protein